MTPHLPPGLTVLERGWLSANTLVFTQGDDCAVVDSGYCTHADQTVELVRHALGGRPLARLLNTHLHSDHCGGNAALQTAWPGVRTFIPPGDAAAVRHWDETVLTYAATGQLCPRFSIDGLLHPGETVPLAGRDWQIHAARGHDPHAVVLFEPDSRTLLSADALWENGFGVVFPELEGVDAFDEVGETLDLIENLRPAVVVPGHGRVFTDVQGALARARSRLAQFTGQPAKHLRYALKVLVKFKLLELQRVSQPALREWAQSTPYVAGMHEQHGGGLPMQDWLGGLVDELVKSGAAAREGDDVVNAGA